MLLKDYLEAQMARGKCCFSLQDVYTTLKQSRDAIRQAITRLLTKGELVSPTRGFYVIIPPEYRILGCIPADQFLPYLMKYLGQRYYGALLTAASYHGASHQAPQVYQIMIEKVLRPIVCGRVRINFITNSQLMNTPTTSVETPKSRFIISTPEATAMDLLRFIKQSGGLDHIATILIELVESINIKEFKVLLNVQHGVAWKQRLGYLLELLGSKRLANIVKRSLAAVPKINYVQLNPYTKIPRSARKNRRWKIIENAVIDPDI